MKFFSISAVIFACLGVVAAQSTWGGSITLAGNNNTLTQYQNVTLEWMASGLSSVITVEAQRVNGSGTYKLSPVVLGYGGKQGSGTILYNVTEDIDTEVAFWVRLANSTTGVGTAFKQVVAANTGAASLGTVVSWSALIGALITGQILQSL